LRWLAQIKKKGFGLWQGANRSDTGEYREDLQHHQGQKDAGLKSTPNPRQIHLCAELAPIHCGK
jgi:hypothetical protein